MPRAAILAAACCISVLVPAFAQPPAPPSFLAGGWRSCQELKDDCAFVDADLIIEFASIDPGSLPLMVGTCYTHSNASCPGCACLDYVKLSYNESPKGFDGGTGCIGWPAIMTDPAASRRAAALKLKQLCEEGKCCCPEVEAKPCSVETPVYARDPITGSCCTFPNPCSAPTDWKTGPQQVALCH
jgi:hypothetical protein